MDLPSRPWQKVGADVFQWKNGDYLVLVANISRYIEVCNLPHNTSARQVIERCKGIVARSGCPEVLITDNGPQCSCHDFAQFAKDFDFTHVTSSPNIPTAKEKQKGLSEPSSLLL